MMTVRTSHRTDRTLPHPRTPMTKPILKTTWRTLKSKHRTIAWPNNCKQPARTWPCKTQWCQISNSTSSQCLRTTRASIIITRDTIKEHQCPKWWRRLSRDREWHRRPCHRWWEASHNSSSNSNQACNSRVCWARCHPPRGTANLSSTINKCKTTSTCKAS